MNILDQFFVFLFDIPLYAVNGVLWIAYTIASSVPALVSLACAGLLAYVVDDAAQRLVAQRPLRGEHGMMQSAPRTAQMLTGFLVFMWTGAQWGMAAPVPWIGAAMWLFGLVVILMVPAQRFNLLHGVKTGIAMYAAAVIASRIYMAYTSQISPEQWAALVGSAQTAANVVASTQGNANTIIVWALWLVLPLGYFAMLLQQVFMNSVSLINPFASYEQMLIQMRDRGGR